MMRSFQSGSLGLLLILSGVLDLVAADAEGDPRISSLGDTPREASGSAADGTFPGKYLIAFHVRKRIGPRVPGNQGCRVYLAYSNDGGAWAPLPGFEPFQGSAPDIIKRKNAVYIYTPDPDLVTRYDASSGKLQPGVGVTITQADGTRDHYGDVTPYLDPVTRRIILFYKSTLGIVGDPQFHTTCPECSATEVDGSEGAAFVKDDGSRIDGGRLSDMDIFYDGSQYILYVGNNPRGPGDRARVLVYASPTLRGTYAPVATLPGGVLTECGSVPQGYFDPITRKYWTYITELSPVKPAVIKRAVHADFSKPLTEADFVTVISNSTFPGLTPSDSVESPGFSVNE